jgi:polyadenylate-binding protein
MQQAQQMQQMAQAQMQAQQAQAMQAQQQAQAQRQQQAAQQQAPGPQAPLDERFLAQLNAADKGLQRNMLGERLYPLISAENPQLAGKITGMLLELDTRDLLGMLVDRGQLRLKVNEAISVLRSAGQMPK